MKKNCPECHGDTLKISSQGEFEILYECGIKQCSGHSFQCTTCGEFDKIEFRSIGNRSSRVCGNCNANMRQMTTKPLSTYLLLHLLLPTTGASDFYTGHPVRGIATLLIANSAPVLAFIQPQLIVICALLFLPVFGGWIGGLVTAVIGLNDDLQNRRC